MGAPKGNKNALGNEGGRPSEYRPEYAEQAYKLCLLGHTDEELGVFFGVSEATINNWKKEHVEFFESITRGKDIADANVVESLYQRALGYSHKDVHISSFQGAITVTPLIKYYPPDTEAAKTWLFNRQPKKWRNKQSIEHTGAEGRDLLPEQMTDDQIRAKLRTIIAQTSGSETASE